MDFVMMLIMFTIGTGIHVVLWTMMIQWFNDPTTDNNPFPKWECFVGFVVLMIGSFLILTSILIVVKIATGNPI